MVDLTEIRNKVIALLAHILKISKETITDESTLESLGADSLNRVQIVMELEDAFNVEISDDDAEKLITVKNTIEHMQKLLQK